MGYADGTQLEEDYQTGVKGDKGDKGDKGQKGDPRIRFKLTKNNDYDMNNKRYYNLDTQDNLKDGDYDALVKNLKSAFNKECLNDISEEKIKMVNILICDKMSEIQNHIMMVYLKVMIWLLELMLIEKLLKAAVHCY